MYQFNLFAAQDFALLVQFSSQDSFKNRWSLPALKMPILKTCLRSEYTPPPTPSQKFEFHQDVQSAEVIPFLSYLFSVMRFEITY